MRGDPEKGSVPQQFKGLSGILAFAAAQSHTLDSHLLEELQGCGADWEWENKGQPLIFLPPPSVCLKLHLRLSPNNVSVDLS